MTDPLRVLFGEGKIGVINTSTEEDGLIDGVAFTNQDPPGIIGAAIPNEEHIKTTDDVKCFLLFNFLNFESVQVVIEALEVVRTEMIERDMKRGK